jgi:hypothetical protein
VRARPLAVALVCGAALWALTLASVLHACAPDEPEVVTVATVEGRHEPRSTTTSTTSTTTTPPSTSTTAAPPSTTTSTTTAPRLAVATVGVWDQLAGCEADGRWQLDARYDGGLQFDPPTWTAYVAAGKPYALEGVPAYAWQASREQQIAVAVRVRDGVPGSSDPYLNAQGWRAWPRCSRILGLR